MNAGLLVLAGIQLFTCFYFALFAHKSLAHTFGNKLIPEKTVTRFIPLVLWMSVSIIYLVGFFDILFTMCALLLAVLNVFFEIISYNLSETQPTVKVIASVGMGGVGIWCLVALLQLV